MKDQDKERLIKETILDIGKHCAKVFIKKQHEKNVKPICVRRNN